MWLTVQLVLYLTESRMPSKIFVMGKNSISGQYIITRSEWQEPEQNMFVEWRLMGVYARAAPCWRGDISTARVSPCFVVPVAGVTTPVHSYREKMLALTKVVKAGIRPHVIVSADSIDRGIFVEQLVDFPLDQGADPSQEACMYSQVGGSSTPCLVQRKTSNR
jgi:hypothetical protein